MTTLSPHTTRANGTVLTATIYNADHVNHITNAQALNDDKVEGATPPVVDGNAVVFDGTSGVAVRDAGSPPLLIGDTQVLPIDQGGTGQDTAAEAFVALKQTATDALSGVVELATVAEVRSSADGALGLTADHLETAAAPVTLTDAATIAVDWATFINAVVTLGGNRTFGNPSNPKPGQWRRVKFIQDGTGSRTITWDTQYVFPNGDNLVLSTAAGAIDTAYIYCDTTTRFEVHLGGLAWAA